MQYMVGMLSIWFLNILKLLLAFSLTGRLFFMFGGMFWKILPQM